MDLSKIKPDKKKALFLAKKQLAVLVYDAVNLEGINFTLPEVQTLLDGITVGGHKLSDQQIALNQSNGWKFLFCAIENNTFDLTSKFAHQLHALAAKEESLEWGCFRKSKVTIAGSSHMPPQAIDLPILWQEMIENSAKIKNIYDRAIFIFLQMARTQFFYDVNKRMGRFMMNGVLLQNGLPAINVPATRQLEFNELMLKFYTSGDTIPMTNFMKSCYDPKIIDMMM